ncbi:MAG: ribosome maturation factor RimM [Actinomycetota bacterium]
MTGAPTVAVGRIVRPHGVRGELGVLVLSEVEGRFAPGAEVLLPDGRALRVRASRPHRSGLIVEFEGVGDRDAAAALAGSVVSVPASSSPPLPEGRWWDHDLVGCAVATDTGLDLGTVDDVIHSPANDIWSVLGPTGETLIPVLRDLLVSVDIATKRIVVRDVPGLTTPEA